MKRAISALFLAVAFLGPLSVHAHEAKHAAATIRGELVDTGCYLGHAAKGASHASCATQCINAGMPMGILTRQGVLYLVTMNHDNPDSYNKLKSMAGKNVVVTGQLFARSGMKAIEVSGFKPVG